jgi:hypothetical protein
MLTNTTTNYISELSILNYTMAYKSAKEQYLR